MKLCATDLRRMITECVQRILEYHGAIDDSLKELAENILSRLKREENFTLTPEEVNAHYPYSKITKPLNVQRMFLDKAVASYNPGTNTLKVSPLTQLYRDEYLLEILIHELTHFVNDNESDGCFKRHKYPKFDNDENETIVKKIDYLFDFSEMSARISQFKWRIRARMQNRLPIDKLKYFEDVTRLTEMRDLIDLVTNDIMPESEEEPLSIIELLLYRRAFHKTSLDGKDRELNMSQGDFEKTKQAIVKKMTKAYKEYFSKISKILYDEMTKQV